jgi:CDP-paratose 2-epimerase
LVNYAVSEIVITGGAGFIGSNVASHLAQAGHRVVVLDNLARPGVVRNSDWLAATYSDHVSIVKGDVRDPDTVARVVGRADIVFHLAAQVAVTTSVSDPRTDFEVNALGTLNVLEAARRRLTPPIVLFASTNKVYGGLEDLEVEETAQAYHLPELPHGIDERRPLDFHSPYGCSKGSADQYVIDYSRIYDMPTIVFRMSCIYGPRQYGNEDQGWIAHFAIRALHRQPLVIYGDGKQVRDVLYVDDLIAAYLAAVERANHERTQVYNLGGGPENSLSLLACLSLLEERLGAPISRTFDRWRPGDQRVYISDTRRAQEALGWRPKVSPAEGITRLLAWLEEARI